MVEQGPNRLLGLRVPSKANTITTLDRMTCSVGWNLRMQRPEKRFGGPTSSLVEASNQSRKNKGFSHPGHVAAAVLKDMTSVATSCSSSLGFSD